MRIEKILKQLFQQLTERSRQLFQQLSVRSKELFERLSARLAAILPARQIYFRTDGNVRFVVVPTRIQAALVVGGLVAVSWITVTSANFLFRDAVLADKEQTIAEMQTAYSKATNDMRDLQLEVLARTRELEARQAYLESLTEADPSGALSEREPVMLGPEVPAEETDEDPAAQQRQLPFTRSAAPETMVIDQAKQFRATIHQRFDNLQSAQTRLAMTLTGFASVQLDYLEERLKETGLRVEDLLGTWDGSSGQIAAGGPFVPALGPAELTGLEMAAEPAFQELASRWDALQKSHVALLSMPSADPAEDFYISSRFGRRRDPLNNSSAMHSGLDMAGWPGTKILVVADGVVAKAGTWGPYGKMIEIDHGNGFMTRYGHLRRVNVTKGERLTRGQTIGEMGCSGRCTSTHLHYEVWFGGKARNPLPYLKVAQDVYQIQERTKERNDAVYQYAETVPASE